MRAKDQLHPYLSDLMAGYSRFKASAEWEGRGRILHWSVAHRFFTSRLKASELCRFSSVYIRILTRPTEFLALLFLRFDFRLITLNALSASDEITDEQSRQVGPFKKKLKKRPLSSDICQS